MGIETGLIGIGLLFVLLALRVPIAVAMLLVSWGGLAWLLAPSVAWGVLSSIPVEFAANWTISAVPMFLRMGYIAFYAGLTTSLFELAKALLARLPGSLAVSSIIACSGFAAVCGSSLACAAAMGRIAIPEMVRAGYDRNFACGTVAAGGTIGALIPPSIIMILFGIFAQVSILKLFVAGIGIGLLTALCYIAVILLVSWRRPDLVPRTLPQVDRGTIRAGLIEMGPVILLRIGLFGGLFGGIFTTTEAGAVGAALAALIAFVQRRLTVDILIRSVTETVATSGSIFVIGVGAMMFTKFLSISGTGDFVADLVNGMDLGYYQLALLVVIIYLVLGTFMDGIGAMLITLPIFLPILDSASIDLIWFGILLTKLIEIGMITPPFGLNVFVIRSVVGDLTSLVGIFRGILFFFVADLVVIALAIFFPSIILFLPSLMGN
ncbi:MAG: TRAP transporter large permease subunit [Pseudomonadota bacterium]|nr:TRAP transporter large permease subunit [Pseudomonadota bacterium]